jgi:hypothetical protein
VSALLRRLARKGLYRLFQAVLTLEKEKYGLRYVPAEAVGYAVVCPPLCEELRRGEGGGGLHTRLA